MFVGRSQVQQVLQVHSWSSLKGLWKAFHMAQALREAMNGLKNEPVVDWLEDRLKDELKTMEQRHSALLSELRSLLDGLPEAPKSRQGSKERASEASEPDVDPETSLNSIAPDLKVAMQVASPVEEDSSQEEKEPQIRTTVLKETLAKQPSSLKEGLGAKQEAKIPIYHPIKLVKSSFFEVFFSFLILLQALCLALETQYSGLDWGHRLAFEGYTRAAREVWPAVPGFLQATVPGPHPGCWVKKS